MSNNSFLPEKIIVSRNTDRGMISEVFSFDTWANIQGFFFFIFFIMFVFVEPFLSGIFLILYCLEIYYLHTPIKTNIFGILYSGYLILDIKKEWLLSIFLHFFYKKEEFGMIINFNISAIIAHGVLCVFGEDIYKGVGESRFLLFLVSAALLGFPFLLINSLS